MPPAHKTKTEHDRHASDMGDFVTEYEYYPPVTEEMLKCIRKAAQVPAEEDTGWEIIHELEW